MVLDHIYDVIIFSFNQVCHRFHTSSCRAPQVLDSLLPLSIFTSTRLMPRDQRRSEIICEFAADRGRNRVNPHLYQSFVYFSKVEKTQNRSMSRTTTCFGFRPFRPYHIMHGLVACSVIAYFQGGLVPKQVVVLDIDPF
jgi:hypothetical protein